MKLNKTNLFKTIKCKIYEDCSIEFCKKLVKNLPSPNGTKI